MRDSIDTIINNAITENVLRGKGLDADKLKDSIDYRIEENIDWIKQAQERISQQSQDLVKDLVNKVKDLVKI